MWYAGFNVYEENPCFAKSGDLIKFKPISLDEFLKIKNKIEQNCFQISKTLAQ